MQRHSKIRDRIIECLMSTKTHPTAEWVYEQLKPECTSLSLATVYRNLAQLRDAGVISSLGDVGGRERFDGDVTPHTHIICVKCGRVTDGENIPVPGEVTEKVGAETGYTVLGGELRFYGICPDCAECAE